MTTAAINTIPRTIINRPFLWLTTAASIQIVFGLLSTQFGWGLVLTPFIALIAAVAVISPRAGVYVMVTLAYIRVSLPGLEGIYPADTLALLVIAATTMGRLARGEAPLTSTLINRVLLCMLIAFGFSLLGSHNPRAGVVNWARHLQLFWLTVAIVSCIKIEDIDRVIRWMLLLTALVSVWNVGDYVMAGGEGRVFGPTGPFFPTFLAAAICQSAVGFLFSEQHLVRARWVALWLLYILALICSQTREVMLQVVLAMIFLFYLTWRWSLRRGQERLKRRIILLLVGFSAVILVLLLGSVPLLEGPSQRVNQAIEGHAPTVEYRLFLWKTGLIAFEGAPVLGIGLGQVSSWDEIFPFWRFDPSSVATKGAGAHNDFITYLAETGMIGMGLILVLFWIIFRIGSKEFHRTQTTELARGALMVWLPVCAILMRFFFGTHMFYSISGILTAVYIALLIKYAQSRLQARALPTMR